MGIIAKCGLIRFDRGLLKLITINDMEIELKNHSCYNGTVQHVS